MSIELRVPDLGEAVETATLSVWLKQEGDAVEAGEPIVELETEKTSVEIEAPVSGVLQKVHVEAGTDGLEPGTLLATISEQAAGADPPPSAPPKPKGGAVATSSDPGRVEGGPSNAPDTSAHTSRPTEDTPARQASAPAASPMARRMAAAAGLELGDIPGSGRGGRIGKADVESRRENRCGQ